MTLTILVFDDDDPEHYRIPSVLYGAAGVAGLSVLAFRLFRSELAAVLAPLFLLLDPMWFVHSRIAMLEVFVAAPMIWAFAFALGDREWEPWAVSGAVALAFAAKYTALFLVPPLFLLVLWRRVGAARPGSPFRLFEVFRAGVLTVVAPFVFMVLTWAPILRIWSADRGVSYAFDHLFFVLKESVTWGAAGPQDHQDASGPLAWLPLGHPTWYHSDWGAGTGMGQSVEMIYAIGNPVVWWGALVLALALLAGPALRALSALRLADKDAVSLRVRMRRDDWSILATLGGVVLLFLAGYAPFFVLSRVAFLYYMTLLVPYLALMLSGALVWIWMRTEENEVGRRTAESGWVGASPMTSDGQVRALLPRLWESISSSRWTGRVVAGLFVVAAAALAIFWIPIYTGLEVERRWFEWGWELIPWADRVLGKP